LTILKHYGESYEITKLGIVLWNEQRYLPSWWLYLVARKMR